MVGTLAVILGVERDIPSLADRACVAPSLPRPAQGFVGLFPMQTGR
jgi:hypothetical protein